MDIALEDIKYQNTLNKIDELERNLETIYKKLKLKENEHLKYVLENYDKYIKINNEIKSKKREAFNNILEYIESLNVNDQDDLQLIKKELNKLI